MIAEPPAPRPERRAPLLVAAWLAMLAVSDLPDILLGLFGMTVPSWILPAKIGFLVLFLLLTLAWKPLRRLREYALILLVLFVALELTGLLRGTGWYRRNFAYAGVPFFRGYIGVFVLDLLVAAAVIAVLWIMKRKRSEFFLVKGDLAAAVRPVRWLGIGEGNSWKAFGFIFALAAGAGVFIPTVLGISPTAGMWGRALPLLPAAMLLAAVNAFTEEAYFRASLLATLHRVIGRNQALLITIVMFGLAHYLYGSPPGIVGAAMVGFLAYLLGKAMLETRGFLWPWFIHFVPDVVIFFSYALAYVKD